MSENAPLSRERLEPPEQLTELPEHAGETVAELSHEQPNTAEHLENARQAVEEAEQHTETVILPANEAEQNSPSLALITSDTRRATTTSVLKHIRRRLPLAERSLSRIVHEPAVRVLSEASSKTVTRPSGLLGGGLFAFLGSASYLYLARHIGFRYNYLMFILFFAGGFIAGLLIELLLFLARSKHHTQ